MCKSHFTLPILGVLYSIVALVSAQVSPRKSPWQTLTGNAPLVIARGGFSGLFPESGYHAYSLALGTSVPDVILWCDVQLTKDSAGICFPEIILNNASVIEDVAGDKAKTYMVNGDPITGYFSLDYTLNDLANFRLMQRIFSRSPDFNNIDSIMKVEDVSIKLRPPGFWLNIQHDAFFTQHNLSMRNFVLSASEKVVIDYISSPEVGFLRSIAGRLPRTTKFVFRFLGQNVFEPTTNQTYGSLLKNLTFIKTFASGIMVSKFYIWPIYETKYLHPPTTLVSDAHKEGLEVFASDFMNDVPFSYNYSYDPVSEVLSFIDNGVFSVDGVLSDYPITPSEAIDCFAHLGRNAKKQVKTLVISKCGASGDYPSCTDLAYKEAISNGVDVLDCPVQISKDGIPFCSSFINLISTTTIAETDLMNLSMTIPELDSDKGIFSFNLTWDDITGSLQPSILNPYAPAGLFRNPKFRNSGSFLTLSDFLALTKNQTSLSGILIIVEHAAYLAGKLGVSLTDAVLDALSKAGYDKQVSQKVMIQSTDSAVLKLFKEKTKYDLVYTVVENISDADDAAVKDIKEFADSVVISKKSVLPTNDAYITGIAKTLSKLKSYNLTVYVGTFRNEFVSQAWDFLSDSTVEINSYVMGVDGIDGIISEFPKTAVRYTRNRCLNRGNNTPNYMKPAGPGNFYRQVPLSIVPPAAPLPVLTEREVSEAPLPSVSALTPRLSPSAGPTPETLPPGNMQPKNHVCMILSILAVLLSMLMLLQVKS